MDYLPPDVLATAAASIDGDEYEIIEVPSDEHEVYRLDDDETFENKLIDVSNDGASFTINARDRTDWTIRNIGFSGISDGTVFIGASNPEENTECIIDNVYMGDGTVEGRRSGVGIYVGEEHEGLISINRVYAEGLGDNAFYCSKGSGSVHFSDCYSKNSWVSHYRLSNGVVANCVAVNDGNPRSHDRPNYDGRGVWAVDGNEDVWVIDSDLAMNGRHYSLYVGEGGFDNTFLVTGTQWDNQLNNGYRAADEEITFGSANGNNPVDHVPPGCPTDAEEAAMGMAERDFEHVMEFRGVGYYHWQVEDGPIRASRAPMDRVWVSSDRRKAAGYVEDGESHIFHYDSFLADIEVDDGIETMINGEHEPTWENYPADGADSRDWYDDVSLDVDDSPDPDDLDHTLELAGTGEYYWQVEEGPIAPDTVSSEDAQLWVSDDRRKAAGVLDDDVHVFAYDTFLVDIDVGEDVDATINGEHTPTWSIYPSDTADSRDWYDDVPWVGDDDDPGGDRCAKLEEELEATKAEVIDLEEIIGDLEEHAVDQQTAADDAASGAKSIRERLADLF